MYFLSECGSVPAYQNSVQNQPTPPLQRTTFLCLSLVPISPNRNDIRNYVEMRLDKDSEPEAMSGDLRVDIVRVILEKISNV